MFVCLCLIFTAGLGRSLSKMLRLEHTLRKFQSGWHYNFLGSSECSHFYPIFFLKINFFFQVIFTLKFDSRSHFGRVAGILNDRMPDFLKAWPGEITCLTPRREQIRMSRNPDNRYWATDTFRKIRDNPLASNWPIALIQHVVNTHTFKQKHWW